MMDLINEKTGRIVQQARGTMNKVILILGGFLLLTLGASAQPTAPIPSAASPTMMAPSLAGAAQTDPPAATTAPVLFARTPAPSAASPSAAAISLSPEPVVPVTLAPIAPITLPPVTNIPTLIPSIIPSNKPSVTKSAQPSESTFAPTTLPSLAPITLAPNTVAPITSAPVTVMPTPSMDSFSNGTFMIRVYQLGRRMSDDQIIYFEETTQNFLNATFANMVRPISFVTVNLTNQVLAVNYTAPQTVDVAWLDIDLRVKGSVAPPTDDTSVDVPIESLAVIMFDNFSDEWISALTTNTNDTYFATVKTVLAVDLTLISSSPSIAPSNDTLLTNATNMSSIVPSSAPTTSSLVPSLTSAGDFLTATDRFSIQLISVPARMSQPTADIFLSSAQAFLTEFFAQTIQPVSNIELQIVGQELQARINQGERRNLQTNSADGRLLLPLQVELNIQGDFRPKEGFASTPEEMNLSRTARNFFDAQQTAFITMLEAAAVQADGNGTSNQNFFANVKTIQPVAEVDDFTFASPSPAPGRNNGGGGLAIGAVAAIAACGTIALLLLIAVLYQNNKRNSSRPTPSHVVSAAGKNQGSPQQRPSQKPGPKRSQPPIGGPQLPMVTLPSRKPESSKVSTSSETEDTGRPFQSIDLANSSSYDVESVVTSDFASTFGADTYAGDTYGGGDALSYAYSLDHGIEPTVGAGSHQGSDSYFDMKATVPTEIPMLAGSGSFDPNDIYSVRLEGDKITRECFAPPGRLGIVIDTTSDGPVVHKVNAGSPLEGIIWPGDVIVGIDEVDTRALSATEITTLMGQNMNKRRKLTVLSDAS